MKKIICALVTLILLASCKSVAPSSQDNKGISVFNMNLTVVQNYFLVGYVDDDTCLNRSIEFLEKITQIKCNVPAEYLTRYEPNERNIKDWEAWFKENKQKLYWDDKENKVKIR